MKKSELKAIIKEAAIGFIPDSTSKAQNQVKLMMDNLEQALKYLEGNAFVKTFNEDILADIMSSSGGVVDNLNDDHHDDPDDNCNHVVLLKDHIEKFLIA